MRVDEPISFAADSIPGGVLPVRSESPPPPRDSALDLVPNPTQIWIMYTCTYPHLHGMEQPSIYFRNKYIIARFLISHKSDPYSRSVQVVLLKYHTGIEVRYRDPTSDSNQSNWNYLFYDVKHTHTHACATDPRTSKGFDLISTFDFRISLGRVGIDRSVSRRWKSETPISESEISTNDLLLRKVIGRKT